MYISNVIKIFNHKVYPTHKTYNQNQVLQKFLKCTQISAKQRPKTNKILLIFQSQDHLQISTLNLLYGLNYHKPLTKILNHNAHNSPNGSNPNLNNSMNNQLKNPNSFHHGNYPSNHFRLHQLIDSPSQSPHEHQIPDLAQV